MRLLLAQELCALCATYDLTYLVLGLETWHNLWFDLPDKSWHRHLSCLLETVGTLLTSFLTVPLQHIGEKIKSISIQEDVSVDEQVRHRTSIQKTFIWILCVISKSWPTWLVQVITKVAQLIADTYFSFNHTSLTQNQTQKERLLKKYRLCGCSRTFQCYLVCSYVLLQLPPCT